SKLAAQPARSPPGQPLLLDNQNGDRVSPVAMARPGVGAALSSAAIPLDALYLLRDSGRNLRSRLLRQIPPARIEGLAVPGAIGGGACSGRKDGVAPPFPFQPPTRPFGAGAARRRGGRADDHGAERFAAIDAGKRRRAGDAAATGAGISRTIPGD